jgi:hypothetical protein
MTKDEISALDPQQTETARTVLADEIQRAEPTIQQGREVQVRQWRSIGIALEITRRRYGGSGTMHARLRIFKSSILRMIESDLSACRQLARHAEIEIFARGRRGAKLSSPRHVLAAFRERLKHDLYKAWLARENLTKHPAVQSSLLIAEGYLTAWVEEFEASIALSSITKRLRKRELARAITHGTPLAEVEAINFTARGGIGQDDDTRSNSTSSAR